MLKKEIPRNDKSLLRRLCTICMAVVAAISLTGCITFLTEIRLKGDGSGTMVQTMTMNPEQMKEMMESIAKQMGATPTESKADSPSDSKKESPKATEEGPGPFNEGELKGKAADMGQGVTFVSAEKIDTKTAAGVRVTYAFKDINQLAMNPKPGAALGTSGAGASSKDALKFRFNRLPNGNAVLTIVLPPPERKEPKEQAATPSPSPEPSPEQMAMVRQMFKGLHMGIAVNVEGKVVKTNSPYVEGSKVTLMDIDFDPLLSDQEGFKKLNEKMEAAKGDDLKTMEILKGIKGLKITTAPETSIEFTPQ
jgi:outer membrane murein-binding lipoprotein Lpp